MALQQQLAPVGLIRYNFSTQATRLLEEVEMIHCFKMDNVNIVIDVHSGAIHLPDDLAYDILSGASGTEEKYTKEAIAEAIGEIDKLIESGQLYTKSEEVKETAFIADRKPVVKSLCLHISHDCNLRCAYCFAADISYGNIAPSYMSLETGKQAVDFLIGSSSGRRNLEIDFFGGEPTLNFDVVKGIVEYARSIEDKFGKNFRFTLTTNGLLLDSEKIDYINKEMDNVVLSLDGRKHINDSMRKCTEIGKSSYEEVLPKFRELTEARRHQKYYIRGTFTNKNLDFAADVLHLADLGFEQLSVEPVVAPETAPYSIKREHLPAIKAEYEKLAKAMLKRGFDFNFFHFMLDLTNGPCAAKRITGCGAGTEYLAVTPEGDLYPCHQFAGDEDFCLGSLDKGITNTKWQEQFDKCNIHTKPECETCFAKYFCSGGCAANAFHLNKDIMKPDEIGCEMQKKRLECALFLLAAKS